MKSAKLLKANILGLLTTFEPKLGVEFTLADFDELLSLTAGKLLLVDSDSESMNPEECVRLQFFGICWCF